MRTSNNLTAIRGVPRIAVLVFSLCVEGIQSSTSRPAPPVAGSDSQKITRFQGFSSISELITPRNVAAVDTSALCSHPITPPLCERVLENTHPPGLCNGQRHGERPRGFKGMTETNRRTAAQRLALAAVAGLCAGQAVAAEWLVSGFFSSSVGRFDATTGAHVGGLQGGVGLVNPLSARIGPDSLLYVCSEGTDSIQRYNPHTGAFIDTFVAPGAGGLDGPTSITWNAAGQLLVSSFNNDLVLRYDGKTGAPLDTLVTGDLGNMLNGPDNGMVVGPDGALWVPSYYTNRVLRFNAETGEFLGMFGTQIGRPRVIEFRGDRVYVTAESQDSVRLFDMSGTNLGNFVAPGAGLLDSPVGMAFGPDGHLYVTSSTRDFVNRYDGETGAFIDQFLGPNAGGLDGTVFLTLIPEPATLSMLALAAVAMMRRR
jgi:streptogramin lyase